MRADRWQRSVSIAVRSIAALTLVACSAPHSSPIRDALPFYTDASFTPHWINDAAAVSRVPTVGAFRLVDQQGARVTEADVAGQVRIVNFFYSECGDVCPKTRERLRAIADRYASDDRVVLLSHTVTPHADSVPRLAAFAETQHIDARRWRLLGGPDSTLARLATDVYHLVPKNAKSWGADTIAHTERVLLVDAVGRVRGVYNGLLALEMTNLERDLAILLRTGTKS